jgi:hypothetical protein
MAGLDALDALDAHTQPRPPHSELASTAVCVAPARASDGQL